MTQLSAPLASSRRWLVLAGLTLCLSTVMVTWAGLPPRSELPAFIAGVVIYLAGFFVFGFATWHLLARPMTAGQRVALQGNVTVAQRRIMALLTLLAGVNVTVGGFWDEVWHRKYGLPFGEDLFWRPHLLIYSSFLITMLLAAAGLYILVTKGKGSWQQRFRANPVVGMLVLAGALLMFVTPADPLWHTIYGEDISAWSLPHLMLLISASSSMLLALALQLSTLEAKPWQRLWQARPGGVSAYGVVIVGLALVSQIGLQVLTTEWDGGAAIVRQRPDWVLPGLIVGYATLLGVIANLGTRMAGAATVTGILAVLIRLGMIQIFDYPAVRAYSWIGLLPPMVALDLYYGFWLGRGKGRPSWWGGGAAAAVGTLLGTVPYINQMYVFPHFDASNLLPAAVAILAAALLASWVAHFGGEYLATANKQLAEDEGTAPAASRLQWMPLLAMVGMAVFIVFFVMTAAPPV